MSDVIFESYEPEEPSLTKYNLAICQLYNEQYHGETNGLVRYHYLVRSRIKVYQSLEDINDYLKLINGLGMFGNDNRLEIADCRYLTTYECVAIIKTIWIKLIQRKWRQIYKERNCVVSKRTQYASIKYREKYGRWPDTCSYLPRLKGMLSDLSRTRTSF
jgi:hypothetical protein